MMSMLFNDIVKVIDPSGTTRGHIGAVVDKNSITTEDTSLLIEAGDTIERDLLSRLSTMVSRTDDTLPSNDTRRPLNILAGIPYRCR